MTLIAALKHPAGVALGADSCLTVSQPAGAQSARSSYSKVETLGSDKLVAVSYSHQDFYYKIKERLAKLADSDIIRLKDKLPGELRGLAGKYAPEQAALLIVGNRADLPILQVSLNDAAYDEPVYVFPWPVQGTLVALGIGAEKIQGETIPETDLKRAALKVFEAIDHIISLKYQGVDRPISLGLIDSQGEVWCLTARSRPELAEKLGLAPAVTAGWNPFRRFRLLIHISIGAAVLLGLSLLFRTTPPQPPPKRLTLEQQAEAHHQAKEYDQAIAFYQQLRQEKELHSGKDHPETIQVIRKLALLYREKGDPERARILYQEALTLIKQTRPPDDPEIEKVNIDIKNTDK